MDPLSERRLRDEVIFLHALWYQGPPRPNTAASSATHHHLQPPKPLHFTPTSPEWPKPPTPPPATGWPAAAAPTPKPPPLSAEEQSKLAGKYAHQHAVKAVRKFFVGNNANGCDEIDSSSDDDEGDEMDEDCGVEEIDFFSKLFEDSALREYYEKNFVAGEFGCLVCGALGGKKTGKKYKGCLPLVQHSIAIGKTKKRRAHRAFGQAVCKVLGWDIHRLPEILSMLSGNGDGDGSVASVRNVDSVKDDGAVEESASEGLRATFSASPDADKTAEVCRRAIATTTSTLASASVICNHLHPSSTTQFKKQKKKKKKKKKKGKKSNCKSETKLANNAASESTSSLAAMPSTSGWPSTGWATLEKPSVEPHQISAEEQLILAGKHAHQHALKIVHEFFRTDDSDEIDSDSDDEDEDEDECVGEEGESNEISFFVKVFEEDTKLREYYTKNFAEGEFICLICGAMGGKKTGKKFKGCLPLMQHLTTIAKTKKRKAHRAFGRAVCDVLGWDIDRLPAIESMLDIDRLPAIESMLSDKTGDPQNSLACPGDNENLSMMHQVEQPASDGSNIVTLNEELSREK